MKLINIKNIQNDILTVVTDTGLTHKHKQDVFRELVDSGLDLVEINNGPTPIYKIIDYKKYLYEKNKKTKKKNDTPKTKEIKIGLNIQLRDIDIKINNIRKHLSKKNKVKITVQMRGREVMYSERAFKLLRSVLSKITEGEASQIKLDGKLAFVVISPKKS